MLGTKWATSTRCITADRLQHQMRHTVLQANLNLTLIIHQLPVQVRSFNTPDYLCFTKYLATVQHASYPYPPPIETHWPPTTSYLPSSTIAESPNSNAGYWRQSPSTANSVYGSESGVSGVHTPATSSTMSYGHPESHTWGQQPGFQPPPTRSMSYGNIEGLPQQYPGQGLGIQQDFGRRTSSYPYPTTIDTSQPPSHPATMGGSTSGPLSAPVLQSHQFYPPAWNSYEHNQMSPMQAPGRSMSGQWYAEPGHLDQVQEEGGPPIAYSQHGVPQYYSGA